MSDDNGFGTIEGSFHKVTDIKWKLNDFLSIFGHNYEIKCSTFSFANTSWYLRLVKDKYAYPEWIRLFLVKEGDLECAIEYSFIVKKIDGSIGKTINGVFTSDKTEIGHLLLEHSIVKQQWFKFIQSGALIIECSFRYEIPFSNLSSVLDQTKTEELTKLVTLSDNLKNFLATKECCDTSLLVKNKEFKAHRALLMARSSVFAAMFQHDTSEKQTGIIKIPDCDPDSFDQFLQFLYSGKLDKPSFSSALHLYETSDKYDVEELKTFCSEFLAKNLTELNLCDLVVFADKYDDKKLQSVAQDFFNKNVSKVLVTVEWDCLLKNHHRLANSLLIEMVK